MMRAAREGPPGPARPLLADWAVSSGGTVAALAIRLVSGVIVARALGPTAMGVFALLMASADLFAALIDLGLGAATVVHLNAGRSAAGPLLRRVFWGRLFLAGLLWAPLALAAGPLSTLLFGRSGAAPLLAAALGGAVLATGNRAIAAVLRAQRRFARLARLDLMQAVTLAGLALALAWAGRLTLDSAVCGLSLGTAGLMLILHLHALRGVVPLEPPPHLASALAELARLWRDGRWFWLQGVTHILVARLDLFFANAYLSPHATGLYSLAASLAGKVGLLYGSLHVVLLPRLADRRPHHHRWLRGELVAVALAVGLLVAFSPLLMPLVPLFYGTAFAGSGPLAAGLVVAESLNILGLPLLMAPALAQRRLALLWALQLLRLALLALLGPIALPLGGAWGAVALRALLSVAALLTSLILYLRWRRGSPA